MTYFTECDSPLGKLTAASDGTNMTGFWIDGQKYFLGTLTEPPVREDDLPVFFVINEWLFRYFSGKRPSPAALPLQPNGSEFRHAVWERLLKIPYGETTTYGAIAAELAAKYHKPVSAQAVGGAVGHNPISVIIPCHRVIGADGSLTGYAGGTDKKLWLLRHEGAKGF